MRAAIGLILAAGMAAAAPSPGLVEAEGPADVAALALADPDHAAEVLAAADVLGLGDPVAVIFAAITPNTPEIAAERLAAAAVAAAPGLADQIFAATVAAAGIEADRVRLDGLLAAILTALAAAAPDRVAEESLEILNAILALADPALLTGLAETLAALTPDPSDDGAALLAALGQGFETGATQIPFGEGGADPLIIIPKSAAENAPSAN